MFVLVFVFVFVVVLFAGGVVFVVVFVVVLVVVFVVSPPLCDTTIIILAPCVAFVFPFGSCLNTFPFGVFPVSSIPFLVSTMKPAALIFSSASF